MKGFVCTLLFVSFSFYLFCCVVLDVLESDQFLLSFNLFFELIFGWELQRFSGDIVLTRLELFPLFSFIFVELVIISACFSVERWSRNCANGLCIKVKSLLVKMSLQLDSSCGLNRRLKAFDYHHSAVISISYRGVGS